VPAADHDHIEVLHGPQNSRGDRSGRPLTRSPVHPFTRSPVLPFSRPYAVLTHLQSSASPGRLP
jgi:hypothetical protein